MSQEYLKQMLNIFLIRIVRISNEYGTGIDYIQGQLNEACSQLLVLEQEFFRSKKREL